MSSARLRPDRSNDASVGNNSHFSKDTATGTDTLSVTEERWRNIRPFLHLHQLELRDRYKPDWTPSWKTTGQNPRDCDDGPPRSALCAQMDARLFPGDHLVNVKYIASYFHPDEVGVMQYLNSPELRSYPDNACVPLVRGPLRDPANSDISYVVTPLLRDFDDPRFDTKGEALGCLMQVFKGLAFMHRQNVAYRCPTMEFMVDPSPLYPDMFHPNVPSRSRNLQHRAERTTRTRQPPRYYFTDFAYAAKYEQGAPRQATPVPISTYSERDREMIPPEFRGYRPGDSMPLRDPFPADVFCLGMMVRTKFVEAYSGLEFLRRLADDMTVLDPSQRPTMDFAVQRLEDICSTLSRSAQRSRLVHKSGPRGFTRSVAHALRTLRYKISRLDPIPLPPYAVPTNMMPPAPVPRHP
ncbi:hypothetical protein EIP91_003702 [Steccherinum ochraceum]|uniref:Protein kinase domain-containing protein n=1 Tax=Steccherinum ochraceum TaxID=92696 RepID=A0A4R0RNH5_9APHY|nr:hypothetical protein EIP91_003702 [Steccherinum ochraceum]